MNGLASPSGIRGNNVGCLLLAQHGQPCPEGVTFTSGHAPGAARGPESRLVAHAQMPIRVAFNATPLLSPVTGIGNYIVELGAALAAHEDIDAYSFYRHRWRHEHPAKPIAGVKGAQSAWLDRVKPFVRGPLRHAAKYLGFRRGLHALGIDLYHEQNYVPLAYEVPVIITVHDLSWIRYPEAHPIDRVRWLERGLPKALDRAHAILVDSEFIRREVLITFGIDRERVRVAHLGVARDFCPRDSTETGATMRALGLEHGGYILTVGTIEPRKNLSHILESYAQLPAALRTRFPLVIAGAKGWQSSGMVTRLRNVGGGEVRFLGHVERRVLTHLYSGAALFAFPSMYEGFGFPPLEAMASGAPVIVSDRASLPEVVGDAGEMMDPFDSVDTASRITALLEDPGRRADLAERGVRRAARFTWASCAAATSEVYREAVTAAIGQGDAGLPGCAGAVSS